jgi:hypothetical protein
VFIQNFNICVIYSVIHKYANHNINKYNNYLFKFNKKVLEFVNGFAKFWGFVSYAAQDSRLLVCYIVSTDRVRDVTKRCNAALDGVTLDMKAKR